MIRVNPYVAGNPVGGEEAFVGRADVLAETLRMLRQLSASALVLYGQRRIGKTSVLLELAARLPEAGPYLPVYFDLQDKAALPLSQVLGQLADEVRDRLPGPDDGGALAPDEFRDRFLAATLERLDAGSSLVFLFDEFDVLDNPSDSTAGAELFPFLRDLISFQPERLRFVFVIGRRTEDLSNLTLSLFKSMRTVHISLLAQDDVYELVRLAERNGTLRWSREAISYVYTLAGGHPYLTQQLCQEIWESSDPIDGSVEVTPEDVTAAVESTLRSATGALEWLWAGLGPAERVVAAVLAEAGPEPIVEEEIHRRLQESGVRILIGELRDAPRVLQAWDLIEPVEGAFRFRVEILRRWIAGHKPIDRVREEMDRVQPVADSLFQAAYGFYQGDDFDQAVPLLRQVISLNPNHIRGQELLAEILLAQDQRVEARKLLETLHEYHPAVARPRLVQVLLREAQDTDAVAEKAGLYERVLELEPGQPEARSLFLRTALAQAEASDDLPLREILYRKILALEPDEPQASKGIAEIRRQRLAQVSERLARLEKAHRFQDALALGEQIHREYPDMEPGLPDLEALGKKTQLEDLYQQAVGALEENDRDNARDLLVEIVVLQADYREATWLLHKAVHGETGAQDREPSYRVAAPQQLQAEPVSRPVQNRAYVHPSRPRLSKKLWIGLAIVTTCLLLAKWALPKFLAKPTPVPQVGETATPAAASIPPDNSLYTNVIDRLKEGGNAAIVLRHVVRNTSLQKYATRLYLKISLGQGELFNEGYARLYNQNKTCAIVQAVTYQINSKNGTGYMYPEKDIYQLVDGACGPLSYDELKEALSTNCCDDPSNTISRYSYLFQQSPECTCLVENYLLFGHDTEEYICSGNSWPFRPSRTWTLPEATRVFDLLAILSRASRAAEHYRSRSSEIRWRRLQGWEVIAFDLSTDSGLADDLAGSRISGEDAQILLNIIHMDLSDKPTMDPTADNKLQASDLEEILRFLDAPSSNRSSERAENPPG